MKRAAFVATHKLKEAIPELKLEKGILLRQVNPFGEDVRHCYTESEWNNNCRTPWYLHKLDLEPLPEWEEIQKKMIDDICSKSR